MPLLVDGDNLLGTWPDRGRSDAERRALAMQLGRLAARQRRQVLDPRLLGKLLNIRRIDADASARQLP